MLLLSAHGMLAAIAKTPELMLDKSEAASLALAVSNVSRHYDVSVSAKALDWTNLMMALGSVYGTRAIAIRMRKQVERSNRAKPVNPMEADQTGFDFDPSFVPGA